MYESFYKLNDTPFKLIPNLKYYYFGKSQQRALTYLKYGITQGEGFIVITGEVGTGKTTLIQCLLNDLKNSDIAIAEVAAANLDAKKILPMICAAFGISYEKKSDVTLLKELKKLLLKYIERNTPISLIIDEAQTLTDSALEELRILSNLQVNNKALIQIILVGQNELRQTLASNKYEHIRQRIIASYEMEALSEQETRAYIEYRLEKAGWDGDPEFEEEIFLDIYDWSNGIPRKINTLCNRILLYGFVENIHKINVSDVKSVVNELNCETSNSIKGDPDLLQANKDYDESQLGFYSQIEWRIKILERKIDRHDQVLNTYLNDNKIEELSHTKN
jgi:general secretion pathway protein A